MSLARMRCMALESAHAGMEAAAPQAIPSHPKPSLTAGRARRAAAAKGCATDTRESRFAPRNTYPRLRPPH